MNILLTIVAFVAALGSLIVVHELGHFLVARWCNVKVLRFSVGFGRALWRTRRGSDNTEWVIAVFPLGGYVKMLDEREGPVAPEDVARAFNRQSAFRRIAIVSAGPVANFLFAIALYWALFLHGVPGIRPIVGACHCGHACCLGRFFAGRRVYPDRHGRRRHLAGHALVAAAARGAKEQGAGRGAHRPGAAAVRTLDLSGLTPADLDSDFLRVLGLTRHQPVPQADSRQRDERGRCGRLRIACR